MSSHMQSATFAQLPPQLRWKKAASAVAPVRADHSLMQVAGRTQTSAGSGDRGVSHQSDSPKKTPVAKVPPVKRRLPTDRSCCDSADDVECRAPSAKKPMQSWEPIRIATNPMYRRRSGDTGTTPTACPGDWRFAVANVAFPAALTPAPAMERPRGRRDVQTSPSDPPADAVAATPVIERPRGRRDVQTSPADPPADATPSISRLRHTPSRSSDGMSLSSWIRSTRGRMAARLRRSLSAASSPSVSRTPTAAAAADAASTPKRVAGSRKRRFASMQRLVRCLTPKSFADASRCPKTSPSPAAAAARGRILQLRPDGSRLVHLQRGSGAKFGFVVARERDGGVCLKQFNDAASQLCYSSVIGVGDQILEVEGIPTVNFELAELHKFVSDKRTLELLVRSQSCCDW